MSSITVVQCDNVLLRPFLCIDLPLKWGTLHKFHAQVGDHHNLKYHHNRHHIDHYQSKVKINLLSLLPLFLVVVEKGPDCVDQAMMTMMMMMRSKMSRERWKKVNNVKLWFDPPCKKLFSVN